VLTIIEAFADPSHTYTVVLILILWTIFIQGVLVVAIFVWLSQVASKKMNSVWIEHRARFFYQIFAVTILGVFVFMDILFEMTSKESFLNITQSISYMLQSCSILIFLLAR